MKTTLNAVIASVVLLSATLCQAYLGGFEAQDGYQPFFNDVKGYNAGQYGTNNGGPGGSPAAIPVNTGLWSRLDPVTPGFSYATGHQHFDRVWVNSGGTMGSASDRALVLTTNHQGWNAGALHYRYDLDSRDFNGAPVASSANSVVNFSFWWCARLDPNVGDGYFGNEIAFFDAAGNPAFRLGLTERNTGDKVTYWDGTTMFESGITAAASRYDRWDISLDYVSKTVSANYFEFATSTLHTLVTGVPMMNLATNGLNHLEFRTSPGAFNAKLMSVDDFSMEVEEGPAGCMKISDGKLDCVPNSDGGYTYTYQFTLTNLTGQTVSNLLVPAVATLPNDGSVTLSPPVIPLNLANGASTTVSVTINGASPGQKVCFRIALFDSKFNECCAEEICLVMPCVKFLEEIVECVDGQPGVFSYTPTLINASGGPVKWVYFIPKTPGVQIIPGQFDLGVLPNNGSATIGPMQIFGAAPNSTVEFYVVLIDEHLEHCCIEEHQIVVPDCGRMETELAELPTGMMAEPCREVGQPAGDGHERDCLRICNERLVCDFEADASGCVLYTFTVTNDSAFPVSTLVFPDAAVTPGQVFFNPPLAPGQASTVTVKICGQPAGSFVLPMVALGLEDGECCSIRRELVLPPCDCLQVVESKLECIGIDEDGNYCYAWSAVIQNLDAALVNHVFLLPDVPSGVTFAPQYFNFPPIGQFGTTTISTVIKVPGPPPPSISITVTIHDSEFDHCCAVDQTLELPDCCDCDITLDFARQDPAGGGADGGGLPPGVTLLNLQQDAEGKIGFPDKPQPFPYVYMAASGRGTIVRIDANSGAVLGEYRTVPQSRGGAHSPSRTTVDRFGECWVGNRMDNLTFGGTTTGSVMRIGLVIGGTRGNKVPKAGGGWTVAPNPAGQYLEGPFTYISPSVVDRDGDGLIRTSAGLGDILTWDSGNLGTNNNGGVSLADDECIVTYTRTRATQVRALAIDANNDLWVGGWPSLNIYGRISGATGIADLTTVGPNPGIRNLGGGYGALIDSNNVLWSVSPSGNAPTWGLYRHHLASNTTTFISSQGCYGIGIDLCDNSIWVSSVGMSSETRSGFNLSNQFVLRKFSAAGVLTGAYPQPRPAQGLSVDGNGHPFVSGVYYNPGEVWHYSSGGALLATLTGTNVGSTGTAVDHNGKIWVSDFSGNQALRMNPTTNTQELAVSLNPGATPYNYSDMTGYVSLNAAGQFGMMQYMHDSGCPDTDWGRVSWQSIGEDRRCTISVEVRASNDPLNFPSTWTPVKNMQTFCGRGIKGQYLQVRVSFRRPAGCPPDCNPQLCSLRIECCETMKGPDGSDSGQAPVISAPDVVRVVSDQPTVLQVFASDADGDPLVAFFRGGDYMAAAGVVGGAVAFHIPLNLEMIEAGDGQEEFTIDVSDGRNVTGQIVTVLYGDQPPTITAPSPRKVLGFSAPVPDFRPEAVVYDDITPVAELLVSQDPPPGTVVGHGLTQVRLVVMDGSGKTGQAETYFEVADVVSVGGVVNYQVFAHDASIRPVPVLDGVDAAEVAFTELLVNGVVERASEGLMGPLALTLPPGSYQIAFRVINDGGQASQSRPVLVHVLGSGEFPGEPPDEDLPLLAIQGSSDPDGDGCELELMVPLGKTMKLMRSVDLVEWELMETITGTGAPVIIKVDPMPDRPREFFQLKE